MWSISYTSKIRLPFPLLKVFIILHVLWIKSASRISLVITILWISDSFISISWDISKNVKQIFFGTPYICRDSKLNSLKQWKCFKHHFVNNVYIENWIHFSPLYSPPWLSVKILQLTFSIFWSKILPILGEARGLRNGKYCEGAGGGSHKLLLA